MWDTCLIVITVADSSDLQSKLQLDQGRPIDLLGKNKVQ